MRHGVGYRKLNRTYQFTVTVTDGISLVKRSFSSFIVSDTFVKADNEIMKASNGVFTADETIQYEIGLYEDRLLEYLYLPDDDERIRLLDDYVQLYELTISVRLYMGQGINFGLTLEQSYEMYLDRHTSKSKHPLLLV